LRLRGKSKAFGYFVVNAPPAKKKLSSREVMLKTQGKDPYLCPKCQEAEMVVLEIMHGIKGLPMRLFAKDKKVKLVV
jgi:hypothetical protein